MPAAEFEEAVAASRRAIELEPWMPEAFLARASLASMQGRAEDAVRDFEEAIRLNPANYFAHYLLGRHYLDAQLTEKALEHFRIAARLAPEEYTPLGMLASALQRLGKNEECLEIAQQALPVTERYLEMHPDDDVAMSRAATFAAWLGKEERAIELAEHAMRLRPGGIATLYNGACVYTNLGRHDRAIELLDEMVGGGRGNLAWLEQDEDLAPLRNDPRFIEILNRLRNVSVTKPAEIDGS
jgi:adenylate cyclase